MDSIAVDTSYDDGKSSVSYADLSDTTSLNSEISAYRYENGRTYHAYHEGQYWGPNDKQQNDGLELGHHMCLLVMDNKLTLVPLKDDIERIVDVGTGTGLWAIDMAEQYPNCTVIGTDLSPIQAKWVPPNVRFEIDDCCLEWTYKPSSVDFVHVSLLLGSVSDWPGFYKEAMRCLKPGAQFEQREMGIHFLSDDGSVEKDSPLGRWGPLFAEAGRKMGRELDMPPVLESNIRSAGFANINVTHHKLPVGGWARDLKLKTIGRFNLEHCEQSVEGWAMALLTRVMGWTFDEVKAYVSKVKAQLKDKRIHGYIDLIVVNAEKPT